MKKRYLFIIPILLILVFIGTIFWHNLSSISGEYWFFAQDKYIDQLCILTEDLDDITTLYINGSISYEDYKTHMNVIKQEFDLVKANREKEIKKIKIKEGTHTFISKKGCESIDKTFEVLDQLINTCCNDKIAKNVNYLSYEYIAGGQALTTAIADYITAKAYYDPDGMIHAPGLSTETSELTSEE